MAIDPLTQEHHYLPQFYQRRWAGADGKLTVFERPRDAIVVKRRYPRETAKHPGLYAIPGACEAERNALEDKFWKRIDQWGANALSILESTDPAAVPALARDRWTIFLLSLVFRDPISIGYINRAARRHYETEFAEFAPRYDEFRNAHEPETFEEFIAAFDQPGLSEYGSEILRSMILNKPVREKLLTMNWQVVDVANPRVELMTSDYPLIRYKGLAEPEGLFMLPLGPRRFFVAYNDGPTDVKEWIEESIVHGHFMESMNDYVVRSAGRFAYAKDESSLPVAERWLRRPQDPVVQRFFS